MVGVALRAGQTRGEWSAGRKQRIRDEPEEQWPGIGQWLAGLADISPRDLEQLLIVLSDAGPQGASLALDLLGPFPPLGGDYCAAFVVEMARLTRPGAAAYAKEMLGRLRESEQIERLDPAEMDYAAGLIAWSEDRFQDLVTLWLGVADLLDDDDLERPTCAAEECPRELQQAVITSLETRAQGGERERDLLVAEARTRFRHISIDEQVEGASKALAGLIDRGHYGSRPSPTPRASVLRDSRRAGRGPAARPARRCGDRGERPQLRPNLVTDY